MKISIAIKILIVTKKMGKLLVLIHVMTIDAIKMKLECQSEITDISGHKLARIITYLQVVIEMKKILIIVELGMQFLGVCLKTNPEPKTNIIIL